jgi:hypothetical protein
MWLCSLRSSPISVPPPPFLPPSPLSPTLSQAKYQRQGGWELFTFANGNNWTAFVWDNITTVAVASGLPGTASVSLAHAHHAKVVMMSSTHPPSDATNRTAQIAHLLSQAVSLGLDGINLDIEGYSGSRDLLTAYVTELAAAFRRQIPAANSPSTCLSPRPDSPDPTTTTHSASSSTSSCRCTVLVAAPLRLGFMVLLGLKQTRTCVCSNSMPLGCPLSCRHHCESCHNAEGPTVPQVVQSQLLTMHPVTNHNLCHATLQGLR